MTERRRETCRIRSGSVLVTASYGHYGQRAARIGPDRICQIQLPASVSAPFFQRRHGSFCANRPESDLDGLAMVWPNASGLKVSWCAGIIWPSFWQDATGPLPISHFQTRFRPSTDAPDNIVQNQPGSVLVLAECTRFWPNGSSPEKKANVQESPGPLLADASQADPARMRIGSGMFTGTAQTGLWGRS